MSSHCVDDEVGRNLFAVHSANAGNVRDSLRCRRACQQTHDGGAATYGEEPFGDTCDRVPCSKTVTEWPCRASIIATESPMTPPPSTRIVDIPPQQ
jgi:hypothetical protein